MAEIHSLLVALLFLAILVIGSILIMSIGAGLLFILGKIAKKLKGEMENETKQSKA